MSQTSSEEQNQENVCIYRKRCALRDWLYTVTAAGKSRICRVGGGGHQRAAGAAHAQGPSVAGLGLVRGGQASVLNKPSTDWIRLFADKGPSSQSYGVSSSHIQIWELDHKEGWVSKNWCFQTMVLEKTLESPLDCKEIQPVHPKGNQSWIYIGRMDAEAEVSIPWPPNWKRPWCWERLKAGGEGGDRGWDGWMASPTQWIWVCSNSYLEQTPEGSEGQGSLECCSPWSLKESDMSNWTMTVLWKVTLLYSKLTNLNISLTPKHSHRSIQNHFWPHIWALWLSPLDP